MERSEKLNIQRASDFRNKIVHYEFELNRFEVPKTYSFSYLNSCISFIPKYLKQEIHAHIVRGMWQTESRLMIYFKQNFVMYNGVEMTQTKYIPPT